MKATSLLPDQLLRAWHKTIKGEYSKQLINSERGLQVYFCKHLLHEFKKSGVHSDWRLFIEPCIKKSRDGGVAIYPDIVICSPEEIIGVVELKYQPRVRPRSAKDMNTLAWLIDNRNGIHLSNDRYRGERPNSRNYSLAKNVVLCWGGVYTGREAKIQLPETRQNNVRLMVLHALTKADHKALSLPALPNRAGVSISPRACQN